MEFPWNWETAKKSPGAGIIVVRKFEDGWRVLGLWLNKHGVYDIPKGHRDANETPIETAMRETYEESNISQLKFGWSKDYYVADQLVVFLAETKQDARILPNKESGLVEHDGIAWLNWEEMMVGTYDYIAPAIVWAKSKVEKDEAPNQ